MLKYGQKVFLINHGAGIIIDIEYIQSLNNERKYVILYFILESIKIYVPIENLNKYNIRGIGTKSEILENLNIINNIPKDIDTKWNKRYRQNNKKISTGILKKQCEVIRDLNYLKKQGKLPPIEEKMLNKVDRLVASEIALAFDISFKRAYNKIKTISE